MDDFAGDAIDTSQWRLHDRDFPYNTADVSVDGQGHLEATATSTYYTAPFGQAFVETASSLSSQPWTIGWSACSSLITPRVLSFL